MQTELRGGHACALELRKWPHPDGASQPWVEPLSACLRRARAHVVLTAQPEFHVSVCVSETAAGTFGRSSFLTA